MYKSCLHIQMHVIFDSDYSIYIIAQLILYFALLTYQVKVILVFCVSIFYIAFLYTDGVIRTFTATNCEDRQTFPNPSVCVLPRAYTSLYYLIFIYSNIRRGPFPRVRNVDGATPRRDIRRIDGILHFFPWTWAYGHVDAFHPFRSAINTRCNILLVQSTRCKI